MVVGLQIAPPLAAQALHSERFSNGTILIAVVEPLSDATTVAWAADAGERPNVVTSGDMTLIADLEAAFAESADTPAPPVVVAVGGVPLAELRAVFERTLTGRQPGTAVMTVHDLLDEGRMERRLGPPGTDAEIRLRVNLPPPSDAIRTSAEVLWDLIPEILAGDLEGLRSRIEGHQGVLEARVDADRVDMALKQLRLGLAQISENPRLEEDQVEIAARRLLVQRRALLEKHPQAALDLLALWFDGGTAAVREFLFAAEGVTFSGVRDAARQWLPQHPGSIVVFLPPRALNPRFASPPEIVQLNSGLAAAILERPGSSLSVVCLRPVVVPDLDDEMAATILTRVARALRAAPDRPGWVEVTSSPPQLELAAPASGFAELVEVLRAAVDEVADDERPVPFERGDARRRALTMMAGLLGVSEASELTPAALLRSDNLSLGIVAEDDEAAAEAIRKFWGGDDAEATTVRPLPPVPRTRAAVAGTLSALVVALDLPLVGDEAVPLVLADLLRGRAAMIFPDHGVEVLAPFVPGYSTLLLVVTTVAPLGALEERLQGGWGALMASVDEEELIVVRRRVAAAAAARWSGATGQARRCAAVATGTVRWRPASEMEMGALSVSAESINLMLSGLAQWEALQNTAAGVLPIVELGDR